ncbi:phytoene dehydrogenase [Pacificimonas flava]|uniref:Phytoene dehydrogenase n=2 Tax=Pacificimonas TaxID=1960290 RepID=A0A219B0U7_9SPHN|nr:MULTISPECIES: phytoene desaturase [Pacificimonas]MBZ6379770.1 phytoene desaturase [Pacificimonas aurantium]OWV31957.1 phytoene dehydrogenase [Pacificimonas flava]
MAKLAVIGAGFGGLALAIRLQTNGHEVTLVERREKIGGRAYVWEREGYVFDAGPTVITDPPCLEELFAGAGRSMADYVDMLPVQPFYRLFWEDGTTFDYTNDEELLFSEIGKLNPADVEGYAKFLDYAGHVYREGYEKLGHEAFLDFKSMISAAPALMRYEAFRSVYAMVSRYIKDEKLRQAFSFHTLLVGGNPYKTSAIYALIHKLEKEGGVWFPKGGTHALVRGLAKLFEDLGGELITGNGAERFETEGDRVSAVILEDGTRLRVDGVGSNADIVHTYADLLKDHPRGMKAARALAKRSYSPSLFVLYFGVEDPYPDVPHHSILFGERYKGLLDEIYGAKELPEDFSLYLHHPTATDPDLAPPGCSTFYVLAPVPHMGNFTGDWDEMAARYGDTILAYLEEHLLPGLRQKIAVRHHFTPKDFSRELNAHLGSAFSLEPVLWQSAYFRVHNRDDKLKNLYFCGAGTHPGAGIPGVVGSAKATAKLMRSDFA